MIDFTSEGEWDTSETKGFYFEKNDMRKMYEDWELLFYEENLTSTYDGSKQVAAFLVAKKPYSQK